MGVGGVEEEPVPLANASPVEQTDVLITDKKSASPVAQTTGDHASTQPPVAIPVAMQAPPAHLIPTATNPKVSSVLVEPAESPQSLNLHPAPQETEPPAECLVAPGTNKKSAKLIILTDLVSTQMLAYNLLLLQLQPYLHLPHQHQLLPPKEHIYTIVTRHALTPLVVSAQTKLTVTSLMEHQ